MKILIFGATGMVGQGVLLECLKAADVTQVTCVGRTPVAQQHAKLTQLMLNDITQLQPVQAVLADADACFFCLGVSSSGMKEAEYRRITYDLTMAVATQLAAFNPRMVLTYVSGAGTDSTEQGGSMWARVKGKTENDLQKLPFAGVFLFRPGAILPLDGITSKTPLYHWFLVLTKPVLWLAARAFPNLIVDTRKMGRAMLSVARQGSGRQYLEARDIARLAGADEAL